MRKLFYLHAGMCGGDSLPRGFDVDEFGQVLQRWAPDVEIVAMDDPDACPPNLDRSLISDTIFSQALAEYRGGL